MKIKKYPQSCVIVETKKVKILVDPSSVKFEEKFIDEWKTVDVILITHRHSDHINAEVLSKLDIPIYSTKEVSGFNPNLKINVIKNGDMLQFNDVTIEVVNAIHGYVMAGGEILENVGFIIDDKSNRLYITSDTIRFKHDYKADILYANITAFDASMNLWGAMQTFKEVGAKVLIVAHQDAGKMMYTKEQICDYLNEQNINFVIPEVYDVLEY